MSSPKTIKSRLLWDVLSLCMLVVAVITESAFAAPGIKITSPQNGTVVHPGDEITVRVEAIGGFMIKKGGVVVSNNILFEWFTHLPATFNIKVPTAASGALTIGTTAYDVREKNIVEDEVTIKIQQTAELLSLAPSDGQLWFKTDWNGNVDSTDSGRLFVKGVYADGITRDMPVEDLIFTSSNTSVATVDSEGIIRPKGLGEAKVTVACGNVAVDVLVCVEEPSGIRPKETIPPTTAIDIQPPANAAGWYNKDITITITATDNEGGSGVQEIYYQFPRLSGESQRVDGDEAVIPFSNEGVYLFRYVAYDYERNSSGQQSTELYIDKTPPSVTLTAEPSVLWPPNNKMVKVAINGEATDKLSGIASVKFKVIDEYGKVQPVIRGFGSTIKLQASRNGNDHDGRAYTITATAEDKAGNTATATTTVTVPHDMGKGKGKGK